MENNMNEVKLVVQPKFNFIYEMGMPTGRKIRTSLIACLIFIISSILLFVGNDTLENVNNINLGNFSIIGIVKFLAIFAVIFTFCRAIICTVVQYLSYKHTKYSFFEKYMIYEDDFLNQHKKNIQYENVKEVEIRRTIWDRILGFGIIVIYTSAENNRKNGLVIYGIRDVKEVYDQIQELIHNSKENKSSVEENNNNDNNNSNNDNSDNGENFIENMSKQVND